MKTILLILLVIVITANEARSEQIPEGCYVAYSNPGACWTPYDYRTEWQRFSSEQVAGAYYSPAIASLVYSELDRQTDVLECLNMATEIEAKNFSQAKLIKALRRKCGNKCKKIK